MSGETININKFISSTGYCSRREADRLIESGRVKLNGDIAKLGNRVLPSDEVLIDGKPLQKKPEKIYIALNKPKGIISTTDTKEKNNIIDYVNYPERIFPIGRLDKPSEGLILLTNDGDIINKILRSGNLHEKEYVVAVNKPITDEFVKKMSNGIPILGKTTKKCEVIPTSETTFKIILTEGMNRQIRRMCEYLGYEVKKLKRTRIMHIPLGNLKTGKWRNLNESELKTLFESLQNSKKTEEASIKKKGKLK